MSRFTLMLAALFCLVGHAPGDWIREVEIASEPARNGQKDFTVRILPARTHRCETLVFECVYHQEFPWVNARGKEYVKIHEPVRFAYRRKGVKFVNDLDKYVSFRVPVSLARLQTMYGDKVFNAEHPVTVARMKISVLAGEDEVAWSRELPAEGKHVLIDPEADPAPLPPAEEGGTPEKP